MSIKLNQFIKNLNEFNKNPMAKLKKEIIYIVYATLWQMAKHTIIDTGQARFLLMNKFCEKYGISYDELFNEYYNYWENLEKEGRIWGANLDDSKMSEMLSRHYYGVRIAVNDDGLYAQEYASNDGIYKGKRYPSPLVEEDNGRKRDNSNFFPRHITKISDMVNSNNFRNLENFNYDAFINEICKLIDRELIK